MDLEFIKEHFTKIGQSYYKSDEFAEEGLHFTPLGELGSCELFTTDTIFMGEYLVGYNSVIHYTNLSPANGCELLYKRAQVRDVFDSSYPNMVTNSSAL
jgi:hypothetical protein